MIKAEPKSVLQFLATHCTIIQDLVAVQNEHKLVLPQDLANILKNNEVDVERQLFEYKILKEQGSSYRLNTPYLDLFNFIGQRFKALLPEEISKFGSSIELLFTKIKKDQLDNIELRLNRIEALMSELIQFTQAVKNSTASLLDETKALKANLHKIEYAQKVKKARFWIDHYISPLNEILDTAEPESIFNHLQLISEYANVRIHDFSHEQTRLHFLKLHTQLQVCLNELSAQSKILTKELSPLLERIRTESEYLRGFHIYLNNGNCYKHIEPPKLLNTFRFNTYSKHPTEEANEYVQRFKQRKPEPIVEEHILSIPWMFNRVAFKQKLEKDLPIQDFFVWCKETLIETKPDFNFNDFFMVTSLVFEEDYTVRVYDHIEYSTISTGSSQLKFPKLKIVAKNEVPKAS